MPFEILRNDITRMHADVIVNTANPSAAVGRGTDAAIYAAAGPELIDARRQIGRIEPGCCAVTPAYDLNARFVIHAVGPRWQGGDQNEPILLRLCYDRALALANDLGARSIAFPLISTGFYGFPKTLALEIAVSAFRSFLEDSEMQIYLVVWDRDSVKLSEQLHESVAKYVDEHYVAAQTAQEYAAPYISAEAETDSYYMASAFRPTEAKSASPQASSAKAKKKRRFPALPRPRPKEAYPSEAGGAPSPAFAESAYAPSLSELVRQTDAGFSETLLKLIDKSGKKDSEIYRRANLSRQHFSKIRSNPAYRPTKATALALAIALELDLDQTKDLIGRAGYALSNSSKFDVIVSYFIRQGRYDMFEINAALFEFDQLTLGAM